MQSQSSAAATPDPRAVKIFAKSIYRELKASGYSRSDMVGFTNALLELMTSELKGEDPEAAGRA